jgi:formamidopyrimidine-DNA glycosylase
LPELPEVEVIRRQVGVFLVGRTVSQVTTTVDSNFFLTRPLVLKRRLPGRRVDALKRVGKYLVVLFDDGSRLLLHLGMTGQLLCAGVESPRLLSRATRGASRTRPRRGKLQPDSHTHLCLAFRDGGQEVFFRDVRRFGRVQLLRPDEGCTRLDRLGVDALVASGEQLFAIARKSRRAIKSLLLDQSVIAGIGNIYADEALFLAALCPSRRACRLTTRQCRDLMSAAKRVMQRSIEAGGSSIRDYVQPDGSDGGYQNERLVYGRTGEPCINCGTQIVRTIIGQRAAHYCPNCQHAS